jgi:hypothetical protein
MRDSLSNRAGVFTRRLIDSSTQPPLRFGDDAEDSLSNRRVIKKPRFLMRGDIHGQAGMRSRIENYLGFPTGLSGGDPARAVAQLCEP